MMSQLGEEETNVYRGPITVPTTFMHTREINEALNSADTWAIYLLSCQLATRPRGHAFTASWEGCIRGLPTKSCSHFCDLSLLI